MYAIGTEVRYHGSVEECFGMTLRVARHCHGGTRYVLHTLDGVPAVRHARHVSITPVQDVPDFRAILERAIADERPVMITYIAADSEWTTRTIEPYELAETGAGDLIVRAMDHRSGEPRSFRLDRLNAVDVLPGAFRLDHSDHRERAALARLRAEIRAISPHGYGGDAMHWTPDCPIPAL